MTKRENFVALRELVADNAEMVAFIDKEIALLDKKRSTPRKPSSKQIENDALREKIVDFLKEADMPKSIKDISAEMPELAGFSSQRVSGLLSPLVKAEKVVKTYEKKVPFFSAV